MNDLFDKKGRPVHIALEDPTKAIVVHPQFLRVGTGEAHLVKGYNATGRFFQEGYGVQLVTHSAGDIAAVSFPLNMKLKDIDNMRLMEKGSHAVDYCYLRHIGFTIDLLESGYFSETADDVELFHDWPVAQGSTAWNDIGPLEGNRWTLRTGLFASVATPDDVIASGAHTTFAAFKATTLGELMIKNIIFYYPGAHTIADPMWAMLGSWSINGVEYQVMPSPIKYKRTVLTSKAMLNTTKTVGEVISESTTAGTDWDFAFGGTGYITKAIITHDADITPRLALLLFNHPVAGTLDDEGTNTSPLTTEVPYYVGRIDFPAMSDLGDGDASALATPSTTGSLPLAFVTPTLYGVLVMVDTTATFIAEDLTISLTAELED